MIYITYITKNLTFNLKKMEKEKNQDRNKNKYFIKSYLNPKRWSSYSEIIRFVLEINPSKILEIGIGNGLIIYILKKMGYYTKGLDIDNSLNPDYIIDIREVNILNFKYIFDLIIASEVFEHIKYSEFLMALNNLSLISKYMILSLPYTNENAYKFFLDFDIPLSTKHSISLKLLFKLFLKKSSKALNKEHFWEIGIKSYNLRKVKRDIKKNGWIIIKSSLNRQNPYHYFIVLKSNNFTKRKTD